MGLGVGQVMECDRQLKWFVVVVGGYVVDFGGWLANFFFSSLICEFEWSVCWLCANMVVVWVVGGLVVGWFFMILWWLLGFDGL